ncbi:arylacetamide deacetylase-like 2 [Microtus ochrogaster]|uniref:Arylacetamide deacetylase-like 2 n=1 Tax=Microtus ochrogaster TaxID=79684 RepID=A0ABM0KDI4_MICOH|nr:arylacetamide deacetylase-like 2 [Microtus ochrogaster]
MGNKSRLFGLSCILLAYYTYIPIPENIEEPWKMRLIDIFMKIATLTVVLLLPVLKVVHSRSKKKVYIWFTFISVKCVNSYLNGDDDFNTGLFYCGSPSEKLTGKLHCIFMGRDYRLAPQYLFPAALEDCIFAIKFFLQDKVLEKYGVDPARICISGDSSGGALVGSVTQLLQDDPEYRNKIKTQAMIYPKLQIIDTWMPSYREYKDGPFLSRKLAIKVSIRYITEDEELPEAILRNEYMPEGSRDLFKFVNWSHFLPEKYKKNHVYREPILGTLNASYPVLLDSRLSPLLVNDSQLQKLPLTYIITCEHDILRDDGLIYVTRLRNAGVPVTHEHIEDAIHGAISFVTAPMYLHSGLRILDKYISWLQENL